MSFGDFLDDRKYQLMGLYLLQMEAAQRLALELPYPPSVLTSDQLVSLKDKLIRCMPYDSVFCDLWDSDLRFEEDLGDDWFFDAALGEPDATQWTADALADYFVRKVDEYALDYDLSNDPESNAWVLGEANEFIVQWRRQIGTKLEGAQADSNSQSSAATIGLSPRAIFRALEHLSYIIECVAQECDGDAKFEWGCLVRSLKLEVEYQFSDSQQCATELQNALNKFEGEERKQGINELAAVQRKLWGLVSATLAGR
jgi:hypothetical protein